MNKNKQSIFYSKSAHGNAVLNFKDSPKDEFGPYAEAFHRSGKILVARLASSSGYSDLDACPIFFLYRHALELYLKGIIITGNNILSLERTEPLIKTEDISRSHRLSQFAPGIKQIFDAVGWKLEDIDVEGMRTFEEFQNLLKDIENVDPNADAFRFPIKSNLKDATLPKHFVFNIIEFTKRIDPILDLLEGADIGLEHDWQERAEAAYGFQHDQERN